MAIRGSITLECDSKGCHAEEVMDGNGLCNFTRGAGVVFELMASGWVLDDDGLLHCPQCCEEGHERDEDTGATYGHPGDELEERRNG